MGFQNVRLVGEPERGWHRQVQISGFYGKSGKIEPPSHVLQSDSACAQESFSGVCGGGIIGLWPWGELWGCEDLLKAPEGHA